MTLDAQGLLVEFADDTTVFPVVCRIPAGDQCGRISDMRSRGAHRRHIGYQRTQPWISVAIQ